MFMVQLLVKFRFVHSRVMRKKVYKYCMNVDDGRIMRSLRSCLLFAFVQNFKLGGELLEIDLGTILLAFLCL